MSEDAYYGYYYYKPREWFAWTLTDAVAQMSLGTVSTLSSALILYIIFRSPVKLKSTYHRIMALLSSLDICLSVPLALATIPIPKSLVPYAGPTLGNDGTCVAQGFFIYFGCGGVQDATVCLAWYYVLTAWRVSNNTITKIYEPLFYTYIVVANLTWSTVLFKLDLINIRHWSPYCGLSPIPSSCWDEDAVPGDPNCLWPTEPHVFFRLTKGIAYYSIAVLCLIVLAMIIVIFVVCRNEREFAKEEEGNDSDGDGQPNQRLKRTHIIVRQAIMYILAFLLTWIFVIIPWDETSPKYIDVLESILVPLGGFWNMLIFVYTKIILVREAHNEIDSNYKALVVLLKKPDTIPELTLSGMENVKIEERVFEEDDPCIDDEEEGISEVTSKYASHPSAYDDLSVETPSVGSHGLSAASKLVMFSSNDKEKVRAHYSDVVARYKSGKLNISSDPPSSSSDAQDLSSVGLSTGWGSNGNSSDAQDLGSFGLSTGWISNGDSSNEMPTIMEGERQK